MKRFLPIVLVVAVIALVVALTSGGTSKAHKSAQTSGTQTAPYGAGSGAPARSAAADSALSLRATALGKILVDARGRTLYLFERDKRDMSTCSGACLSIWPALTSHGLPTAQRGVLATKLGTIAAAGGNRQVTYDGHPLYYYAGDQKPGDTAGQGLKQFGAEWYVLAASGDKIDNG